MVDDRPLADRMRPARFEEFLGQDHLVGGGRPLSRAVESGRIHSMVLWGPPGTGKTTLARLIGSAAGYLFHPLSAVTAGVRDIREIAARSKQETDRILVFVDEVHRFNKAQQDALLPVIEDGTIVFVGATTENPSFSLNRALLSRVRVHVLKPLAEQVLERLLERAWPRVFGDGAAPDPEVIRIIARSAAGDARQALGWLETAAELDDRDDANRLDTVVRELVESPTVRFDRGGDEFYEQISAFHKSVRGSSPDGALYWLSRMLLGGGDREYLARRMVRIASEDVGNADPRALQLALAGWQAWRQMGSPEGELALAQVAVYLASAPKSNAVYIAFGRSENAAKEHGSADVPLHLRNAPTRLMQEMGYGQRYRYDHDEPDAHSAGQTYFPDIMGEQVFYEPVDRGLEKKILEKLKWLRSRVSASVTPGSGHGHGDRENSGG